MARVELTDDALEDLKSFDGSVRQLLAKALKRLEDEPEKRGAPLGHSSATGNLTGYRKLIVGDRDYRIVYSVHNDATVCVVWIIGPRSDDQVYLMATARLKMMADRTHSERMQRLLDEVFGR